jgi:membrane protease YdiL (CAAX protease family)
MGIIPMKKYIEYLSLILLALSGIVLIGLQIKPVGWVLISIGAIVLFFCDKKFRNNIFLIYLSLSLLGITTITTDVSYQHMVMMGTTLILAVIIPYLISRYLYTDHVVQFQWHHGRQWYKTEILYIFFTAAISYLLLPFFLRDTGSYQNWTVEPGVDNLIRLFIGTNGLGLWDELFFVSTVLGILRRYLPFAQANIVQSILFTSFLYELGFRGWGFLMIFVFALIQGYVFKKTESLLYVITIHLTLDFILYLALIHSHHPDWLPIFLIK